LPPQLYLAHDPLHRSFELAAIEAAHLQDWEALLLEHMDHLAGRLDLLKIGFQIEFEQPLNRTLAPESLAKPSLQYLPRRGHMNE